MSWIFVQNCAGHASTDDWMNVWAIYCLNVFYFFYDIIMLALTQWILKLLILSLFLTHAHTWAHTLMRTYEHTHKLKHAHTRTHSHTSAHFSLLKTDKSKELINMRHSNEKFCFSLLQLILSERLSLFLKHIRANAICSLVSRVFLSNSFSCILFLCLSHSVFLFFF